MNKRTSCVKFYSFFGIIFALSSVFNYTVYLHSYAPDWDAKVMVYSFAQSGVVQDGHYAYEGMVLTWFFAAFAVPCLVTVAFTLCKPLLNWCASRLYAWAEFDQYRYAVLH
jgi:hypothetical protein